VNGPGVIMSDNEKHDPDRQPDHPGKIDVLKESRYTMITGSLFLACMVLWLASRRLGFDQLFLISQWLTFVALALVVVPRRWISRFLR
jgi:hypothetical protein